MNDLIEQFYTAFQNLNADKMIDCYHTEIEFEDPAFGKLKGDKSKNMWRMLCKNSKDLEINFSNIQSDNNKGKVHWEARYTFRQTGREVHNIIDAEFEFKDGKIIKHTDHFDLHKWAKQALGIKGWLLGGTSFFKNKLNRQTKKLLDKFN